MAAMILQWLVFYVCNGKTCDCRHVLLHVLMVETNASRDGSVDSKPVAGAMSQSSGYVTDINDNNDDCR